MSFQIGANEMALTSKEPIIGKLTSNLKTRLGLSFSKETARSGVTKTI